MSSVSLKPGRSSVSGITATIFGASGFLGKYVVNKFGRIGSKSVLPYRGDEVDVRHLKLAGDLGVINPVESSIRKIEDIEAAVAGSNVVINLLGKHMETTRWNYSDIHGTFPSVLAAVCAEQGVERLVHVSAMGASHDSPSAWARSKATGEEGVKDAFPNATIIRPATLFGDEDRFLNRIAKLTQIMSFYPVGVETLAAKQQPVYCDDVAEAIFIAATRPEHMGRTYDLAGPKVYTNAELYEYVFEVIKESGNIVSVPQPAAMAYATAMGMIPGSWLSADMVRQQTTTVTMPAVAAGFEELGMTEIYDVEEIAPRYLVRFRQMSEFVDEDEVVQQPRI